MEKSVKKIENLQHQFTRQLKKLIQSSTRRLVIGYSGGIDSTVLLHLLKQQIHDFPKISLLAVYVNHGLQADADSWQQHCAQQCQQLEVEFESLQCRNIESTGKGLEQAARDARLKAFKTILKEDDLLCLAHHANDQTETLFYRLLRGTGIHGLSGIQQKQTLDKITVIRPLLNFDKKQLVELATKNKFSWIEDDSNNENHFDRNFLRNDVIPKVEQRWIELHMRMSQSSKLFMEQSLLLDDLAETDAISVLAEEGYLKLAEFRLLEQKRARNFLSWWFRKHCGYSLARQRILSIYNELVNYRLDAGLKQDCGNQLLIQSGARAFLLPVDFFIEEKKLISVKDLSLANRVFSNKEITMQLSNYCSLKVTAKTDRELTAFLHENYHIEFGIEQKSVRLAHKQHSTTIKNLFQQANAPAWLKPHWPILKQQQSLLSVLGFGVEKEFNKEVNELAFSCLFDWGQGRHLEVSDEVL